MLLPDVQEPSRDLFRVCYRHNGQPLDAEEKPILPGINGKFATREEAQRSVDQCKKWFNVIKTCEIIDKKEIFTIRERNVVDVWIEHYVDGVLQSTGKPTTEVPKPVQKNGMLFATLVHEALTEGGMEGDEATMLMDTHADLVAEFASRGVNLKNLSACAASLMRKSERWTKEESAEAGRRQPTGSDESKSRKKNSSEPSPTSQLEAATA